VKKNPLSREKIESLSESCPTTGCWLWTGFIHPSGYGSVRDGKKNDLAHRASYRMFKGFIPAGTEINHLCNNKSCVNPIHLEAVSHQENIEWRGITGKTSKGKKHSKAMLKRNLKGENHPNRKLTNTSVLHIRSSGNSSIKLAEELNVSVSLIRQVRRSEIWRHI